jgi:hypothetical protein
MLELSEIKKNVTWQKAMDYAVELGEGWRLPTKQEMFAILASNRYKEFATESWSSSICVCGPYNAWFANFLSGYVGGDSKNNTYRSARCIRGSFEDLLAWCFGKEEKC